MVKFEMRGNVVKELTESLAQAAMRVLRKNDLNFTRVGDVVFIKNKESLHIVLSF